MRNLRGTYVHRGDAARRRKRIKQVLLALGFVAATGFVLEGRTTDTANAEPAWHAQDGAFFTTRTEANKLRNELETARGELSLVRTQLERADRILHFSSRYDISAGMASAVFDASVREGIDPELAFRLVNLESEFNPRAVSPVGAIGLTQLMPSTAAYYEKGITRERLTDRGTNLRIGFKYLRRLLKLFDGDVRLALLAYNRGEDAVARDVRAGKDPGNGYDRWVAKGYHGKGTID
jgi:soluble lytic murein transglycosylase-like protein